MLLGLELLQLTLAQAPPPFDFESVGNAEGPPVTAQRLRAPLSTELLEALVIEACHLRRRRPGVHVRDEDSRSKAGRFQRN